MNWKKDLKILTKVTGFFPNLLTFEKSKYVLEQGFLAFKPKEVVSFLRFIKTFL